MLAFARKSKVPLSTVTPQGPPPGIHIGLMATGNQVIKARGAFRYFRKALLTDLSGDEYDRRLVGLDMEAHAVAFVAENSSVPGWLVVKGVCDHADQKKSDTARRESIENAATVTLEYVSRSLPKAYLRTSGAVQRIKELETKSRRLYQQGRIIESGQHAEEAFRLGGRSPLARRQYLRSLLRQGRYYQAIQSLDYFRSRPWYDDSETLRLSVEVLWRQGRYNQAIELLPSEVTAKDRQLLYLKAINLIFANWTPEAGVNRLALAEAQELLRSALDIRKPVSPWWIHVNYVFALLLDPSTQSVQEEYVQALDSIREALALAPRNGTIRLYELLLHALADKQEAFEEARARENDDLQTALDLVDMVLERLVLRYARDDRGIGMGYLDRIRDWILETVQLGKPVRPTTTAQLKRARQNEV
jgi:tetratricopeptide (TPR) repeat protein